MVYNASRMFSHTYKRAVGIDCFGVWKNTWFPALLRDHRRETFSINQIGTLWLDVFHGIIAVADTNCRFMHVDIRSYGKDCDSTIFKRSNRWSYIQTNMLELPSVRPLSGTECPSVSHFFVGDEELTLNRKILRHFVELTWVLKSVQIPLV